SMLKTAPRIPLSPTRRLVPFPRIYQGVSVFLQTASAAASSSGVSGITNQSAGPPVRKEVWRHIGSINRTSIHHAPVSISLSGIRPPDFLSLPDSLSLPDFLPPPDFLSPPDTASYSLFAARLACTRL